MAPVRLLVRPVQQGAGGGWSGGYAAGWTPGRYGHSPFDPRITECVSELGSLWTSRTGYGYGYGSPEWRALDEFAPSALWLLLAEGARLGVPLLGSAARDTVELALRADLDLEATAHGDGGMRLQPRLAFDDVPNAYDVLGTVGTSGAFAVRLNGKARHLVFGPTSRRLSDDDRALIGFRGVIVPGAEVLDFLDSAYPTLRRRVHLRCFDGSVTLPEPPPPRLVLTIASPQPSTLHLGWAWAYGAARYPLHPAPRRFATRRRRRRCGGGSRRHWGADSRSRSGLSSPAAAAVRFAHDLLPMLEASEEVIVEAAELPTYREIEDTPLVTVGASETDDPDWFDLAIRVSVEGREVPFAPLFAAIARGEEYLVLDDGSYLRTDLAVLDRLRELIDEARRLEDRPGRLRLNRYAASLWGDIRGTRRRGRAGGSLAGVRRCAGRVRPGRRRPAPEEVPDDREGRAAAVPEGGVRLAGLPAPPQSRRHPRRRHGAGQDPRGAGPARARPVGAAR